MRSFWEILPSSWSKQHVHFFLLNPSHHLVQRGKGKPPKLGIICESYWLLDLAPKFEQHMKPPLKTKQCQFNKIK